MGTTYSVFVVYIIFKTGLKAAPILRVTADDSVHHRYGTAYNGSAHKALSIP